MRIRDNALVLEPLLTNSPNIPPFIFSTTNQKLTSSIEVEAPHSWLMPFYSILQVPVINVLIIHPTFNSVVIRSWEKNVLGWMPFDVLDILWMTRKHAIALKVVIFICLPNPYVFISWASCEQGTVKVPADMFDFVLMPFQSRNDFEAWASLFKYACCAVERASCKFVLIWSPFNCPYGSCMRSFDDCLIVNNGRLTKQANYPSSFWPHILTFLSEETDARRSPSVDQEHAQTRSSWPKILNCKYTS